jgi:ABC-type glycerol-3-phosphate transport system substrate-binding protein
MLYTFAGNATIDYVNWSTGECNFDSQDFKDILEICNRGTDEEAGYEEDSESMPTLLQSGKVLFCEGSFGLDEMQMYSKMFNDNLVFIGYPAEDKQGSYFSLYNNLGIYSKSEVKDAAWEFIRTFMTKEYQGKQVSTGNMWNIPSRKDAYDLKVQIAMATEKFTDEYGTEHEPVDSTWGWDDLEVQIGPSSQADVDAYTELIDSTTKIGGYNQSIMDIIVEESKSYFTGDKTVDEVADVIQNRVKTYVNENR